MSLLSRAHLLRQHRRHEEAVSILMQHLAESPQDPYAFIELARNRLEIPGMLAEALGNAETACGLLPGHALPQALRSEVLSRLHRHGEALAAAEAAIALDPDYADAWNMKAFACIGMERWADAERGARAALALDPDSPTGSNLLAMALRLQGRLDESEAEARRRLARDPENAFSFANSGWAALQRNKIPEAEQFFKEALRLNPEMSHAKNGLKQSYRARSGFFRLFLKWSFFLQSFSKKNRFGILIAIIFGFRILRAAATAVHPMLGFALALVYYLFLFGTWLAGAIANLLIMKDPVARLSLDRAEKVEGVVVGGGFLSGLVVLVAGMILGAFPLLVAGGTLMLAAVPGSLVFTNASVKGRIVFGLGSIAVILLGLASLLELYAHPQVPFEDSQVLNYMLFAVFIGIAVSWLAMIPALRRKRPS